MVVKSGEILMAENVKEFFEKLHFWPYEPKGTFAPGDVILTEKGEYCLVGDMNIHGGVCDCCTYVAMNSERKITYCNGSKIVKICNILR